MVANKKENNALTGTNWSPGTKEDQTPYKSELTGVDCILAVLVILMKHYNIKKGAITIALDCESALKTCAKSDPLSIEIKSFDILQDIRKILNILLIEVSWRWVEGHQKEKGKRMDWWARRKFDVNLAAKAYLKVCKKAKQSFIPIQFKYKQWAVYCKKVKQLIIHPEKIMKRYFMRIQWPTGTPTTASQFHLSVTSTTKPTVLLEKKLTPVKRRFVAKFCTLCIQVGHTLKYRQYQDHTRCPCCGYKEEQSSHVLLYPDHITKKNQKDREKNFETSFRRNENGAKTVCHNTWCCILSEKEPHNNTHSLFNTFWDLRGGKGTKWRVRIDQFCLWKMEPQIIDNATIICGINSKQKIVPALCSRSNPKITHDYVECMKF